jgi:hypothetical protein
MKENGSGGVRQEIIKKLRELDPVAIENSVGLGTPDINYIGGWMELKYIKNYPKRSNTKIRLRHFTKVQRNWIKRRYLKGGNVCVLLRIERDWYLFKYPNTHLLGELDKEEMKEKSTAFWEKKLIVEELIKWLR